MKDDKIQLDPDSAGAFGRKKFIEKVCASLGAQPYGTAIFGFRGMGKTSILAAVERDLGTSRIIHTDCTLVAAEAARAADIRSYLAHQWNRSLDTHLFPPDLALTGDDLPRYLREREDTSYLLLVLDDFDKLGRTASEEVAGALMGLLNDSRPYLRCLLSTAVDLPTLAGRIDSALSFLSQHLTLESIPPLTLQREELRRFAKTHYAISQLQLREVEFLEKNCGSHPALLQAGLTALARYRPESGSADKKALWSAYQALSIEAKGLPERILHDLLLDQPAHQDWRFYLYGIACQQETWARGQTEAAATTLVPPSFQRAIAIEWQFENWFILVKGTGRIFSDFAADTWARQSTTDAVWRETMLAPVRNEMSALELCIFDLFCQHPGQEFSEEDIQKACWPSGEPPCRKDRAVYAAVMRVSAKLDSKQRTWEIKKQGRGRGWTLVMNAPGAT